MKMKKCSKCREEKVSSLDYFSKNSATKDGLSSWCRKCVNKKRKEYRKRLSSRMQCEIEYPEVKECCNCKKIKSQDLFYKSINNKDGLSSACKGCSDKKDKERRDTLGLRNVNDIDFPKTKKCSSCGKRKMAKYFSLDKRKKKGLRSVCKRCCKEIRKLNKDIINLKNREYYRKNKDSHLRYIRERRKNDFKFRLLGNLRARVYKALKFQRGAKSVKTMDLIGCSVESLKVHIESKFIDGMSWDNYGKATDCWSIDHIIPCASFDLTDSEEQKKCFHYTNLQPLWNSEQWSKNSYYNGKYIRK